MIEGYVGSDLTQIEGSCITQINGQAMPVLIDFIFNHTGHLIVSLKRHQIVIFDILLIYLVCLLYSS